MFWRKTAVTGIRHEQTLRIQIIWYDIVSRHTNIFAYQSFKEIRSVVDYELKTDIIIQMPLFSDPITILRLKFLKFQIKTPSIRKLLPLQISHSRKMSALKNVTVIGVSYQSCIQ